MWTSRATSATNITDNLTLRNVLANGNTLCKALEMEISRLHLARVLDIYGVTTSALVTLVGYGTISNSANRCAGWCSVVNAGVWAVLLENRVQTRIREL